MPFFVEVTMRAVELLWLLLVVSEIKALILGGRRYLTHDRLESEEIIKMVEDGLKSTNPCSKLLKIISGTVQIVDGLMYRFKVHTIEDSSCGVSSQGNSVSNLSVYLPAARNAQPVYKLH